MSRSLNRVCLIGYVGTRPEVGATQSGARVATFRLATTRPARPGTDPKTDWHTVVAWDRLSATVERSVHKGERVYVEGRIETRDARARGGTRRVTEIVADEILPLADLPSSWSPETMEVEDDDPGSGRASVLDPDDELPF